MQRIGNETKTLHGDDCQLLIMLLSKSVFFLYIVPGEPTNVRVSAVNSTTIHVSWKPPSEKDRNGIIRGYHIHIHEVKDEVIISTHIISIFFEIAFLFVGKKFSK